MGEKTFGELTMSEAQQMCREHGGYDGCRQRRCPMYRLGGLGCILRTMPYTWPASQPVPQPVPEITKKENALLRALLKSGCPVAFVTLDGRDERRYITLWGSYPKLEGEGATSCFYDGDYLGTILRDVIPSINPGECWDVKRVLDAAGPCEEEI